MVRRAGYELALDNALEVIAKHAAVDEVSSHLVRSLQQSIPACVVAIGDGWQGDRFLGDGRRRGRPAGRRPGWPWAHALATGEDVVVRQRRRTAPGLADLARARGLASCWVHPVSVPGGGPVAALVHVAAPRRQATRFTWRAVHRVGRLLRFTLQWDRSHRALEFAASHDTLTGLANRPAFVGRLEEIAKPAEGEAAVLFLDLDGFKPVNDEVGHLAGDWCCRSWPTGWRGHCALATWWPASAATSSRCCASGSPGRRSSGGRRLMDTVAAPIVLDDDHGVGITVSVGVTELGHSEEPEAILARADLAMREAKAFGPGRWVGSPAPVA